MSWSLYMINDTKKVYKQVGKVDKDEFIAEAEELEKINFDLCLDFKDVKIADLTIEQTQYVFRIVTEYEKLSMLRSDLCSLLLYNSWKFEKDVIRFESDYDGPHIEL